MRISKYGNVKILPTYTLNIVEIEIEIKEMKDLTCDINFIVKILETVLQIQYLVELFKKKKKIVSYKLKKDT